MTTSQWFSEPVILCVVNKEFILKVKATNIWCTVNTDGLKNYDDQQTLKPDRR